MQKSEQKKSEKQQQKYGLLETVLQVSNSKSKMNSP